MNTNNPVTERTNENSNIVIVSMALNKGVCKLIKRDTIAMLILTIHLKQENWLKQNWVNCPEKTGITLQDEGD